MSPNLRVAFQNRPKGAYDAIENLERIEIETVFDNISYFIGEIERLIL